MKKIFVLVIAILICFSAVACSTGQTEEVSKAVSVPEESEEEFVLNEKIPLIDGYMTEEIDRSLKAKNIFKGLPYTASRETDDKNPDRANEKLTDGKTMDVVYGSNFHAGWSGAGPVVISFDLGEGERKLADISVSCARIIDYDVGLPQYVSVQASDDGKNYTEIGKIYKPEGLPLTCQYTYYFSFPKAVTARYLRIMMASQESYRLLVDEICGFEYCEDGTIDNTLGNEYDHYLVIEDFYGYELNTGESDVKVSEKDADYNDIRNLATIEGVEFQIQHFDPFFVGHTNSSMEEIHLLTDGVLHGGEIEKDYFKFYRGAGRHVVADLGTVMSVKGCTLAFQDKPSWGITTPPVYYISVSENGTDWVTVFAEHNPDYGTKARLNDTRNAEFKEEYRARYVRLTFPTVPDNTVSCQVYLGEFIINGRKNPANAKTATEDKSIKYGRYPDPEEFGISDILWAGIGDVIGTESSDYHVITEDTAFNYLATVDKNGNATEVLFDSILFTTRGDISWHGDRNEGYGWFLQELFREGVNLDAVNTAKGKINEQLGTDDKVTVWISVNCPVIGDTLNGKEIKTKDDYVNCLKWMADTAIASFNEKGYENLELAGFYWQVENLRPNKWAPDEAYDTEAAIEFNEYVHSKGYLSLWCPYYSELKGIWHSLYYGFDITCWQPNYVFSAAEYTRLDTIAELAKIYGVGIEIEIEPNRQSIESLARYRRYLSAGVKYGFIDSINAYYQGAVPGTYVAYREAEDPICKTIYDESILYIQNKLDVDLNAKEPADLSGFEDKALTLLHGEEASTSLGDISNVEVRYAKTPIYGSVRLDADGTLTYTAMKRFIGEDEIVLEIYDGVSLIKTVTVKVTVTK